MATLGREFDPNKRYKVVLSERLKNHGAGGGAYNVASVNVDSDLKLPSSIRSSIIKPGFASGECNIDLVSAANGDKTSYKGTQKNTKECALIFDSATQTFTLERIDTEFSFGHSNGRASSASEDGILDALIDREGAADANDPYDWRHQLKRHRTPTPDIEPFDPLGVDALRTPSPERKPIKPRPKPKPARRASIPPEEPIKSRPKPARKASTPPKEPTKPRPKPKPARKASTPPEEPTIEPGASPSPDPAPEATSQNDDEEEKEDDSSDGGLQIVMDGATKPRNRFSTGFGGRGRFNQRLDAAPISLRSAANSQSPAMVNAEDSDGSDGDVDEMVLGSPVTERRKELLEVETEVDATQEPEGDGEGDDIDMDAEFAKAMEGDDEDEQAAEAVVAAAPTAYVDESSSESEEE